MMYTSHFINWSTFKAHNGNNVLLSLLAGRRFETRFFSIFARNRNPWHIKSVCNIKIHFKSQNLWSYPLDNSLEDVSRSHIRYGQMLGGLIFFTDGLLGTSSCVAKSSMQMDQAIIKVLDAVSCLFNQSVSPSCKSQSMVCKSNCWSADDWRKVWKISFSISNGQLSQVTSQTDGLFVALW